MKKIVSLICAAALFACCSVTSCKRSGNDDPWNKPINEGATQLSVSNFDGGFGTEWLALAARRFEQKYKDEHFEDGKTGVQITIEPVKTVASGVISTMQDSTTNLYFTEQVYYYDAVSSNKFLDITDIVTETLTEYGETKSIEQKLTKEEQNYYKTSDGKYYGLPHYSGYFGITYDVDLFESKQLFLARDEKNGNNGFYRPNTSDKLSLGPDGIENTYDDGLPATYDEFFKLCARIATKGMTPLIWSGVNRDGYWREFLDALYTDYEGLEQMMLNYTFDGTANNIVKSYEADGNGAITSMVNESKGISASNGYELNRQAGRAYALSFLERLLRGNYYAEEAKDESMSHMEAQLTYLESSLKGEPIAMCLDGCFWFNEADDAFRQLEEYGDKAKQENRRFGFMPLPKATKEKVGKQTLMDYLYSCGFINANIPESKKRAAKLFLQFLYTDESLREFTVTTNCPKACVYTMGDEYDKLSYFGKTLWDNKEKSDIVYPFSTAPLYLNNQSKFNLYYNWTSRMNSETKSNPIDALRKNNIKAQTYFYGIQNYYNKTDWDNNYSRYFD